MGENSIQSSTSVSAWTYQDLNGSNYTLAGIDYKEKADNLSAGLFFGAGTTFGKKDALGIVADAKLSHNYSGVFNQNLRLRGKMGTDNTSLQVRYSPVSVDIPVSDNTSLYGNLHYCGQLNKNYATGSTTWKNSCGAFAGVTQKVNKNTSVSLEVQRYNLQNIKDNNPSNWGVNVGISYKF